MAKQTINTGSRLAQRTAGSKIDANFTELYDRGQALTVTAAANTTVSVPAGYAIVDIYFQNTTANAVTGGIKIGTTSGATDVVAAQAVGANGLGFVLDAEILKKIFSVSAAQTLYIQPVTAWNSASVNITVVLRKAF